MELSSLDLLQLIRPKLEKLAEVGVTDIEDDDQQSLVKLMATKYLEVLLNPLPVRAPASPPRSARPVAKGMPDMNRKSGKLTLAERVMRARNAAKEARDEDADGDEHGFVDEAIQTPSASLPDPRTIQYDAATGQPLIPHATLRLPEE